MYKSRLKEWGAEKYTKDASMATLRSWSLARRLIGKETSITKHGKPWDQHKLARYEKRKRLTEKDGLTQSVTTASVAPGYACVTPPAESSWDAPGTEIRQLRYAIPAPGTLYTTCEPKDARHSVHDRADMMFSTSLFQAVPDANAPYTLNVAFETSSSANEEKLRNAGQHINTNLPAFNISPSLEPPPKIFLEFCYQSCTLNAQCQPQDAHYAAWQAFQVFGSMIVNGHEYALASLNVMHVVLFMQRKGGQAVELLKGAKEAALLYLGASDPIVISIDFMMWQASGSTESRGIDPNLLRRVYHVFKMRPSARHPYTILAGYKLAWLLATNETAMHEKLEALVILSTLQSDADETLGQLHMQSISVTTIRAQVLLRLGSEMEAERTMAEGIRRIIL